MSQVVAPGTLWRNWARCEEASPQFGAAATSADDVIACIRFARERNLRVKPVGAGHSFTAIACTDGLQLDVSAVDGVLAVDGTLVTLGAGTNLYQLPALLAPYGLALANMGDIDRQTISGATSTGTHGTGAAFGGLGTFIRGMTLVTADGRLLRISESENAHLLPAARLGLGALGVIVDVTIECVPEFLLSAVERPEALTTVLAEFAERTAETDHFEFYVWPHTDVVLTKTNTRLPTTHERAPLGTFRSWFEDRFVANTVLAATVNLGRLAPRMIPLINRTSVRVTGNRTFTDSAHEVFASPRTVRFREMEYAIPVELIPEAVLALTALIHTRGWNISFPIEVRSAAADENWLSTAFGRATGYIAVHRYFREDPHEYFRAVEALMLEFGGRPHWGKVHYRDAAGFAESYPRFADFLAIRESLDPDRVFANPYLDRVLGA